MAPKHKLNENYESKYLPPLLNNCTYNEKFALTVTSLNIHRYANNQTYGVLWKWWGETTAHFSRPPHRKVEYTVAGVLFGNYLKLCEVLEFTVCNLDTEDSLGSAFLYDLTTIMEKPVQSLEVVDHSGNLIGFLTLVIEMSSNLKKTVEKNNKQEIMESLVVSCSQNRNRTVRPVKSLIGSLPCNNSSKKKPRFGIAVSLERRRASNLMNKNYPTKVQFTDQNVSCKLKQYKSPSVPTVPKSLSSISGCGEGRPETLRVKEAIANKNIHKNSSTEAVPKLLDFLLGKDLSSHDERFALTLLQKASPCHKFVTVLTENCEALPSQHGMTNRRNMAKVKHKVSLSSRKADLPPNSSQTNGYYNYKVSEHFRSNKELSQSSDKNKRVETMIGNKKMNSSTCVGSFVPNVPKKAYYNLQDPIECLYFCTFIRDGTESLS